GVCVSLSAALHHWHDGNCGPWLLSAREFIRVCQHHGHGWLVQSFALGIVAAEYIMGWVPKGTHDWKKFIKPSELSKMLRNSAATPHDICGLRYNPLNKKFSLDKNDLDVNYFVTAKA
ncbi:MAG: hypothetical protein AAF244_02310, partial [Pseudomonadota bacterium]